MNRMRFVVTLTLAACGAAALGADEGMWRIDQLPLEVIASKYGVRLAPSDLERLQSAPVRLVSGGGGGTGTFASANGLILTNHHVALDCIRTSTLAEQNKARADNLIDSGFTAKSPADELPCKRFKAQIESSARDVTAEVNAGVKPGMDIAEIQRVRQGARSDIERACAAEKGDSFTCDVVDFNSGARLLLIVYEDFKDIRLVYAPEKQLGYFGGDEMNFRFPRYVSDISILRAYQGADGNHGEYDASHVPVKPDHYLHVTMSGVKDGDFTLVAGNPGNTNRYRESYSAEYNLRKGIPTQIEDLEQQLGLLRKYAAMKQEYQVLLQSQIFGLANTLKYQKDVLAALKATNVVAERQRRERELTAFLETHPDLKAEFGGVLAAQAIPAVRKLAERMGPAAAPRAMAHAVVGGSKIGSLDERKQWIDAPLDRFAGSPDPVLMFARDLLPSLNDERQRTRILNEKLLRNRSAFARALAAWKGTTLYPDANFTLRVTYGHAAGYTSHGKPVPFTTRFGEMFTLAKARGNTGDFALPRQLQTWRQSIGNAAFGRKYAA